MARLKSSSDRYGSVAVWVHWLSALLIVVLLVTGFRAANAPDALGKAALLRAHVPAAIAVLLLTAMRILWWWRFDSKPMPLAGLPPWQAGLARIVHVTMLVTVVGMVASGIGMMVLSGAGPAVFGAPGAVMPDFHEFLPRRPHGLGARLMVALLALHAGAALYHHFVRRDATLKRMW
ncbi:MAG: cytochrome b/b6 domain-containing protein [Anaerolineae bacterium]|nr:cytochrome b/b6 domain-containing protein [Anaerolineae bacterium]